MKAVALAALVIWAVGALDLTGRNVWLNVSPHDLPLLGLAAWMLA